MVKTAQEITELIKKERYNTEIIPVLEEFVQQQVNEQTYDLDANLALLKLYQFHPETFSSEITSKILIKALTQMPKTDFRLCMYLIPEKSIKGDDLYSTLTNLSSLLETTRFKNFWSLTQSEGCKEFLENIPGFSDAVRTYIVGIVATTFKTVEKSYFCELLNLELNQLNDLIKKHNWIEKDNLVELTVPEENIQVKPKPRKINQAIQFNQLTQILR